MVPQHRAAKTEILFEHTAACPCLRVYRSWGSGQIIKEDTGQRWLDLDANGWRLRWGITQGSSSRKKQNYQYESLMGTGNQARKNNAVIVVPPPLPAGVEYGRQLEENGKKVGSQLRRPPSAKWP